MSELAHALAKNVKNPHIHSIHFLQAKNDDNNKKILHALLDVDPNFPLDMLKQKSTFYSKPTTTRLQANEAIQYAQMHLRHQFVILANLDIYFDDTIQLLHASNMSPYTTFFLSRYEADGSNRTECSYPFMGSHDAFIWIPPLPNSLLSSRTALELGSWGIENRLLYEFEQSGLIGRNPCESIYTWHVHQSAIKNGWMPQVNLHGKSSVAFPDTLKTRFKSEFRKNFNF